MKVLLINNLHYRRGGADVVYLNTGKLLEKYGHKVIYFSQQDVNNLDSFNPDYFVSKKNFSTKSFLKKILYVPSFFFSIEAMIKISKLIIKEKPEIAHIHLYKGILTSSILLSLKRYKIPTIITLHDYSLFCPVNSFLNGNGGICEKCFKFNNILYCIVNKCQSNSVTFSSISALEFLFHKIFIPFRKHYDKFIVVSKFSEQIFSRAISLRSKITHLYNFNPEFEIFDEETKKGDYFLYFGRLSKEKGLLTLINAWQLSNLSETMALKIAGDGPIKNELQEFVHSKKIKNVHFLGFLDKVPLTELIINSLFVVVPSEWYENNPLAIIEAYSCNKPVIGSKTGGIPEIIIENKSGYLFEMSNCYDLSEKLKTAASLNDSEYKALSANARNIATKFFSSENHYNKLIDLYRNLIK